jgi:hypothetical protein
MAVDCRGVPLAGGVFDQASITKAEDMLGAIAQTNL